MTGAEKRIVALTMMSHALVHFYEQTFPAVLKPVGVEFGLGLTAAGMMANVFPLFFGFAALPAGMAVDKWGARRAMIAYLLTCAAAATATLFIHSEWVIVFLFAVMGISAGLYHPAGTTLISQNVKKVGSALGFHGVGGNLGLALSPLLAAAVAASYGWRASYAVLAIPSVFLAIYFIVNRDFGAGPDHAVSDNEGKKKTAITAPETKTRWGPLILLFLLGMLNGFCYRGMLTFFPTFFAGATGGRVNIVEGGVLTSSILIIGVLGQYIGGKFSDRFREEIVYAASFLLSAPFLAAIGFLSPGYSVVAAGIFAFFYFSSQPVGNSLVARLSSVSVRGRAYGIFFFSNFGVGSFSAAICGWIGEHYGIRTIFPFLGAMLAGVSIIGWGLAVKLKSENDSV